MGLYAAYGSNMDPAQMLRRCPSSPHTGTGWIRGWRLTFGAEEYGWEGALATLVPDDPEQTHPGVFVALYDLTEADERALDAWEGADSGLYRRVHLRVHTLDRRRGRLRLRAGRVRGRAAVGPAPGRDRRRRGGRRRPDRLRHRPALPGVPLHRSDPSPAIMKFGGATRRRSSGVSPLQLHDRRRIGARAARVPPRWSRSSPPGRR